MRTCCGERNGSRSRPRRYLLPVACCFCVQMTSSVSPGEGKEGSCILGATSAGVADLEEVMGKTYLKCAVRGLPGVSHDDEVGI